MKLGLALIFIALAGSAIANAEASSIIGTFSDGYEMGKEEGASDYDNGNKHNSKCPSNLKPSISHCAGYKAGYEVGWGAAAELGDN